MKIEMVDHQTMEVEAESVADHFFLCQFHGAKVTLKMPRPFAHNSCKLELKVVEEIPEETPAEKKQIPVPKPTEPELL